MFLFAPGHISLPFISFTDGGGYGVTITGYITVGDSTDLTSNSKCADVAGIGYYTCASSLRGRYLTFISSDIPSSDYNGIGLAMSNLMAFGSSNLVVTSTLVQEPALWKDAVDNVPSHITSYADTMASLSPRSPVLAPNFTPYTCT